MKKAYYFLVVLVGIFVSSCSTKKIVTTESTGNLETYKVPLNTKDIISPVVNGEKLTSLLKTELETALVSLRTGGRKTIITPLTSIDSSSTHNQGVIVRDLTFTGDDPFEITDNIGGKIRTAHYVDKVSYPTMLDIEIPVNENSIKCIRIVPGNSSNKYQHELNKDSSGDFIVKKAGYQYTDPCDGSIQYISSPYLYGGDVFIQLNIDDKRNKKIVTGYELPKTKN